MAINSAQLKTELQTDPMGLGYAPLLALGAHNALADMLNTARAGYTVNTYQIPGDKILRCLVYSEIPANNAKAYNYLSMVMAQRVVDVSDIAAPNGGQQIRAGLTAIFATNSATYANLYNAQRRDGSRGEVLFGAGTQVAVDDIARALA